MVPPGIQARGEVSTPSPLPLAIADLVSDLTKRILIFAQKSDQRDGLSILKRLSETLNLSIQHAIFTTHSDNDTGIGPKALIIRGT